MMRRIGLLTLIAFVTGCQTETAPDAVLLRFTPTLGEPIVYEISVNLDKTTYGRQINENVSAVSVMTPETHEADGYHTTMTVHLTSHNMGDLIAEHMEQRANAGKSLTISDGLVFSGEDGPSLYLPDVPVKVGESWEAEDIFKFGDLTTLEPPHVMMRFTVSDITRAAGRTTARINAGLLTHVAKVPFQIGHAGIRCDENGVVTELEGDAAGKLRPGDRIVAISGKPAPDPRTRAMLAQNFIEDLELIDVPVQLTVEREGQNLDLSVEKRVVLLGTIGVTFEDYKRTAVFDANAGLLVSDDSAATIALRYTIEPETAVLDDLRGRTGSPLREATAADDTPPRIYEYHWKMTRVEEGI